MLVKTSDRFIPSQSGTGPDPVPKMVAAAYGMHSADQIAIVVVPLIAKLVFDASAGAIGALIACQSLGQLLGSIPFGLAVDRFHSRGLATGSTMISIAGMLGAWVGVMRADIILFGAMMTVAGFGIVLFVLVILSMVPAVTNDVGLANLNSRIELPRAMCSFVIPLVIGAIITAANARWVIGAAAIGPAVAYLAARRLPDIAPGGNDPGRPLRRLLEGGRFVLGEGHLRAITMCALSWNFGFVVLLVAMLPLLVELNIRPGVFGIALSCFGLAAVVGSWVIGKVSPVVAPRFFLIAGPASSVGTAAILLASGGSNATAMILVGFFVLGFGPSMWLVTQNTVRQVVTPRQLLGRVNSMIQTAIYGVRPLSAIGAGVIVETTSPRGALVVVGMAFALSTAAAVFSQLRSVSSFDRLGFAA